MSEAQPDPQGAAPERSATLIRQLWVESIPPSDRQQDAELADLLRLARRLTGARAAAVTVVGAETQWFLAEQGMTSSGVARSDSFCAVAVLTPTEVLTVADATLDPRFADTSAVVGPRHLRFYAGAPLAVRPDVAVGTLCVVDDALHELDAAGRELLQALARQVTGSLQRRRERAAAQDDPSEADRRLGATARRAPFGLVLTDMTAMVTDANDTFCELTGVTVEAMRGLPVAELLVRHQRADQRALFREAAAGARQTFQAEVDVLTADGGSVPVMSTSSILLDDSGRPIGTWTRVESIAVRREAEATLLESQSSVDGILTLDRSGRITSWNEGARRMLGWERTEVLGRSLDVIRGSGRVWHKGEMETLVAAGGRRRVGEAPSMAVHKDGSRVPVEIRVAPWEATGEQSYSLVLRDVSERVAAEQAALRRALTDPLTGLGTRRALADALAPLLAGDGRTALALLDLDRFTSVNEALGHVAGDSLLCLVADRLTELCGPGRVFRTDGDEFALLLDLPPDVDLAQAAGLVDAWTARVLATTAGPFVLDDVPVEVEASMGVALAPDHTRDVRTLLGQADVALSTAKRHRDSVVHWSEERDGLTTEQLALLGELRAAIDDGQLRLHYQPVQAPDGHEGPLHAEALVRWQHPEHGLLGPGRFIPLAEPTRLIVPLTRWVMGEALRQRAQWQDEGLDVVVSVNVSPRAFARADVVELTRDLLRVHACPPDRLVVEITETALHEDPEQARETLQALRELGVLTALDDFGAGSTSLQLLRRFRVDELKLDMLFVRDVARSPYDAAVVRTTVGLAHELKIRMVLEGVEDEECARVLRGLGATHLQGYHVARPMPADQLLGWARR